MRLHRLLKALSLILMFLMVVLVLVLYSIYEKWRLKGPDIAFNNCYRNNRLHGITPLPYLYLPRDSKHELIFFLETSCSVDGNLRLTPRQLCAIESTAFTNRYADIYVLFPANVGMGNATSEAITAVLKAHRNIHFRRIDLTSYAYGTPLQDFMMSGKIFRSRHMTSQVSDVLRYLTLYKYGGLYLDLDVVVVQQLSDLGKNFVGIETVNTISSSVMHFSRHEIGHKVANMCISDLKENFNGNRWGARGPGVITRVLTKLCNKSRFDDVAPEDCQGFNLICPSKLYAIPYSMRDLLFNERLVDVARQMVLDSALIHVWSFLTQDVPLKVSSKALYSELAREFCTISHSMSEIYF